MGLFKIRSNEDKREKHQEQPNQHHGGVSLFQRVSSTTTKPASNTTSTNTSTKYSSILKNNSPGGTAATESDETDANITSDSDVSREQQHHNSSSSTTSKGGSERSSRSTNPHYLADTLDSSSSEREDEEDTSRKYHVPPKSSSQSRATSRRSKRKSSKRSAYPSQVTAGNTRSSLFGSMDRERMVRFQDSFMSSPIVNPFANKGEVYLCEDMATVCDAMKVDLNTQVMLAYYDAKTLEDFCLLAEADLKDLITKARLMRRAIPPLQIRKIEVLREWVQEISKPRDESRLPAWIRLAQPKRKRKSKKLIPEDWKDLFRQDLPRLKHNLQKKGANLSGFASFMPSFHAINMCGMVS